MTKTNYAGDEEAVFLSFLPEPLTVENVSKITIFVGYVKYQSKGVVHMRTCHLHHRVHHITISGNAMFGSC
jgi:hypothetical protein